MNFSYNDVSDDLYIEPNFKDKITNKRFINNLKYDIITGGLSIIT